MPTMPIQIMCPHCGAKGNAPDSIAGQQVRCSKCKNSFTAQSPASAPSSPAAAGPFGFDESTAVASEPLPIPEEVVDARPRSIATSGGFVSFLIFRSFVGPILVVVSFWLMLALLVLISAYIMAIGGSNGLIVGLASLVIGPIILRFICETIAVFFRMNERLEEIAELLRRERR